MMCKTPNFFRTKNLCRCRAEQRSADDRMQQNQSGFDLRHFVNVNFTLPKEGEKYVPPEGQSLREHIDGLWPVLTRSTENTENGILCYRCRNLMSCQADVFARYITGTVTSPC